jgi:hypothetical protein
MIGRHLHLPFRESLAALGLASDFHKLHGDFDPRYPLQVTKRRKIVPRTLTAEPRQLSAGLGGTSGVLYTAGWS